MKKLKGVVLAGGTGTRLLPFTRVTNKHLALVYNRPMIYYPILALKEAGIDDVLVVCGKESAGDFLKLLSSGRDWGMKFTFKVQDEATGIAGALDLAEDFVDGNSFVVILGDNIFIEGLKLQIDFYKRISPVGKDSAMVVLKEVENAKDYGVAEIENDRVVKIVEKPENPKSNLAVTGVYMYPSSVFEFVHKLKPSKRGELEITDVNNKFAKDDRLIAATYDGEWFDAGSFDGILKASRAIQLKESRGEKSYEAI